jgi:hypothetical protein
MGAWVVDQWYIVFGFFGVGAWGAW